MGGQTYHFQEHELTSHVVMFKNWLHPLWQIMKTGGRLKSGSEGVVEQVSPPYDSVSSSNKGSKSQCRCGKGKNAADTQRPNCSKKSDYLSRCPCLQRGVYCTSHCKCSNCDNHSTGSTSSIPIIPTKGSYQM